MSKSIPVLREGLTVGLIGFVSVAVFYAVFDLLAARGGLFTVDLLGKALFSGLRDPAILGLPIEVDATAVLLYSVFHLVMSLIVGLVVVSLVAYSRKNPSKSTLVSFLIVCGFFATVFVVMVLTEPIRPLLPVWSIVVANALAVVVAGTWLVQRHPDIWQRLSPLAGTGLDR